MDAICVCLLATVSNHAALRVLSHRMLYTKCNTPRQWKWVNKPL